MHQRLKERLVGAAVLVVIAVIFIPMLLTGPVDSGSITKTNIPERPTDQFESKLVPITEPLKPLTPEPIAGVSSESADKNNDAGVIKAPSIDEISVEKGAATALTAESEKPDETSSRPLKDKQVGLTAWVVQLGSFSSKVNADKMNLQLRKAGFPAFVEPITKNKETAYRVRVGPELLRSDADKLLKNIKTKMKLDGIVLSYP